VRERTHPSRTKGHKTMEKKENPEFPAKGDAAKPAVCGPAPRKKL